MVEQLKKNLSNPDSLVSLFLGLAVVGVVGISMFNYVKRNKAPETAAKQESTTEKTATGSSLPTSYTVVTGDTLWSIATKTIGSGYNWVDIAEANKLSNPNSVEAGLKLAIPNVAKREPGQIANASVETKRPADGKYTVKKGDSLWNISVAIYGTGFRWSEIAKTNKLTNPNIIYTGTVLNIP